MKIRNGVDILVVSRLEEAYNRQGEKFLNKIFTSGEIAYCTTETGTYRWRSLAGRFAAKEALAKALGTGIAHGVRLTDIEVVGGVGGSGGGVSGGGSGGGSAEATGGPTLILHGEALQKFHMGGFEGSSLSLAHDGDYVVATVVLWGKQ